MPRSLLVRHFAAGLLVAAALSAQTTSGDSDAGPPVSEADLRVAKRAQEILNSESKWNRRDNRKCPRGAQSFSLYCALEKATEEVSGNFEHRGAAMQEARFVIEDISPKAKDYDHRLMDYNNDPGTRFADIQNVLRLLEARVAKRLRGEPSGGNDLAVVKRAREILDSPAKWNRADTQDCPADAKTFSIFCAFEMAAKEVNGAFDDGAAGIHEARSAVMEIAPNRNYKARLTDFNNDAATSFADVQRLFQLVEERVAKQSRNR